MKHLQSSIDSLTVPAVFFLAGFVVGGYAFWLAQKKDPVIKQVSSSSHQSSMHDPRQRVNFHLKHVMNQRRIERTRMAIENSQTAPELQAQPHSVGLQNVDEGFEQTEGILTVPENPASGIEADIEPMGGWKTSDGPAQDIFYLINEQRMAELDDQAEKKIFIEKLKANLRQAGYDVNIDEDGMVQVVRRPGTNGGSAEN